MLLRRVVQESPEVVNSPVLFTVIPPPVSLSMPVTVKAIGRVRQLHVAARSIRRS